MKRNAIDEDCDRVVARFSCGAASAVATKIAIGRYGDRVEVVNAFIAKEHPDNRRFLADCERWLGRKITVLRDERYDADPVKVWIAHRFIVSRQGAKCSKLLKGKVLDSYQRPGDVMVLGYTAEEAGRLDRFIDANAHVKVIAPLIEDGLTKKACFERLAAAGILLPKPYREGFHNSNCLDCPKGGMGYWNKIRRHYPENYEEAAQVQDLLGPGSYFFRDRKTKERISLRMLDPNAGRFEDEMPVECGGLCELSDSLIEGFGGAA